MYYAVAVGIRPGIYKSWDLASKFVSGFSGAKYRKFKNIDDAKEYLNSFNVLDKIDIDLIKSISEKETKQIKHTKQSNLNDFGFKLGEPWYKISSNNTSNSDLKSLINKKTETDIGVEQHLDTHIQIYTDGSCPRNGFNSKIAGIGIHFPNNTELDVSKILEYPPFTNQRAELKAIHDALLIADKHFSGKKYQILTDSQYSINSLTKWGKTWKNNGWKKNDGLTPNNLDIIIPTMEILSNMKRRVKFTHVKGHSGIVGNEKADKLATSACSLL